MYINFPVSIIQLVERLHVKCRDLDSNHELSSYSSYKMNISSLNYLTKKYVLDERRRQHDDKGTVATVKTNEQ